MTPTPTQLKKFWEKIILNSCYSLYSHNFFILSDPEMSEEITNNGKENLKEILKKIDDNFFISDKSDIFN
jgi:DNA polymerase elongation subunit (family B)